MAMNGNSIKKRGLGRGLGALIVNTETQTPPSDEMLSQADVGGVRMVMLDRISPNPQQPRSQFDAGPLEELATSIREHGIIQPLIVTENPHQSDGYYLIAGERRWRAARLAQLDEVPVIVRDASPQQLVEWALVENLQRADLNALEEATAYQTLIDEFSLTQAEIGQRVGRSRSAVANTLRLLQLPVLVQQALIEERISAGHARALLALPDHEAMTAALDRILSRDLSVRQTEELVKELLIKPEPPPDAMTQQRDEADPRQSNLAYIENRFRSALSTKVNLNRNADGSGRLVVHFYSDEDLENLYRLIAGGDDEPIA